MFGYKDKWCWWFLDTIFSKYLKLILEKSDLKNLKSFINYFLSISGSNDLNQCYAYLRFCIHLVMEFKSQFEPSQLEQIENMILNLKFSESFDEKDGFKEDSIFSTTVHYRDKSMPMIYIGNVPFYSFVRGKVYPYKEELDKQFPHLKIDNYNEYNDQITKCGFKKWVSRALMVEHRDLIPYLSYLWLTNVSNKKLYEHLDLLLRIGSPNYCYKFLEEFNLSEEYQEKLLLSINDYDYILFEKTINMLKNKSPIDNKTNEIDYTKEIEKIGSMNVLEIMDLLSVDELISLRKLLKTDKPKIDQEAKLLIKKLNK